MTGHDLTPSQWRTLRTITNGDGRHLDARSVAALARRGYVTTDGPAPRLTPHGAAAYIADHRT